MVQALPVGGGARINEQRVRDGGSPRRWRESKAVEGVQGGGGRGCNKAKGAQVELNGQSSLVANACNGIQEIHSGNRHR